MFLMTLTHSREMYLLLHVLPWGQVHGASSLAVTRDGELPKCIEEPELRPFEGMGSASGHDRAKHVYFPLASLTEKSYPTVNWGACCKVHSGEASGGAMNAKNELHRTECVLHDPEWSISDQRCLNQSKEVHYYLCVRSLRKALASVTVDGCSNTSDLHSVLQDQVEIRV